jgi:hypothetical protein
LARHRPSLLSRALERGSGERAAYLRDACRGDTDLFREATQLLDYLEQSANFIEPTAPESIDRYPLLERIGGRHG